MTNNRTEIYTQGLHLILILTLSQKLAFKLRAFLGLLQDHTLHKTHLSDQLINPLITGTADSFPLFLKKCFRSSGSWVMLNRL